MYIFFYFLKSHSRGHSQQFNYQPELNQPFFEIQNILANYT